MSGSANETALIGVSVTPDRDPEADPADAVRRALVAVRRVRELDPEAYSRPQLSRVLLLMGQAELALGHHLDALRRLSVELSITTRLVTPTPDRTLRSCRRTLRRRTRHGDRPEERCRRSGS